MRFAGRDITVEATVLSVLSDLHNSPSFVATRILVWMSSNLIFPISMSCCSGVNWKLTVIGLLRAWYSLLKPIWKLILFGQISSLFYSRFSWSILLYRMNANVTTYQPFGVNPFIKEAQHFDYTNFLKITDWSAPGAGVHLCLQVILNVRERHRFYCLWQVPVECKVEWPIISSACKFFTTSMLRC